MDYHPLDTTNNEIRLLLLHPATSPDISCTLIHHALSPDAPLPIYTALSYVWGQQGDTSNILVNGYTVAVTRNLFSALSQLRLEAPGFLNVHVTSIQHFFWIDALFINQKDSAERTSQVLRMMEIYSMAEKVIAWLGVATEETDLAIRLIHRLWREIFDRTYTSEEKAQQSLDNEEWVRSCRVVGKLCQLPYWRRMWIIQEVALASKLHFRCGGKGCVGVQLFSAVDVSPFGTYGTGRTENWEHVLEGKEYEAMQTLRALARFTKEFGGERGPLLACLFWASSMGSEATDSRDRVYGMLGLATDGAGLVPNPSYEEPLQVVLKKLAKSFVEVKENLDILLCQNREGRRTEGMPSWAPDFMSLSKSTPGHLTGILRDSKAYDCTAPLGVLEGQCWEFEGDVLKVKALLWDTVACVGPVRGTYKKEPYFVNVIRNIMDMDNTIENDQGTGVQKAALHNPYNSQTEVYHAILAAITRDNSRSNKSKHHSAALKKMWNQTEEFHKKYLRDGDTYAVSDAMSWLDQNVSFRIHGRSLAEWAADKDEPEDVVLEEEEAARMRELQIQLGANFFARRKLIVTETGFVGNSHGNVMTGDKIAMVAGCSVPVVLRQRQGQGGESALAFDVVGDAYVSGVMWGEQYAYVARMAEWKVVEMH